MIDCVIFSRDRPMQLEACLRSLALNAPGLFDVPRIVLPYVEGGYASISRERIWVRWYEERESDFERAARAALAGASELVLMLCDDAITYRPLPGNPLDALGEDVLGFSLRMGRNTVYCHPRNEKHGSPEFTEHGPFLEWRWEGAPCDFGYPYSLDGMIHRRDDLLGWLDGKTFTNPNTMEVCVVGAISNDHVRPRLASFAHSVQVGLPVNRVNETHPNRVGLTHSYPAAGLAERFRAGERIDLDAMDFTAIVGAHQELELKFA